MFASGYRFDPWPHHSRHISSNKLPCLVEGNVRAAFFILFLYYILISNGLMRLDPSMAKLHVSHSCVLNARFKFCIDNTAQNEHKYSSINTFTCCRVFGSQDSSYDEVMIKLDYSPVLTRKCEPEDFEQWSPSATQEVIHLPPLIVYPGINHVVLGLSICLFDLFRVQCLYLVCVHLEPSTFL